MCFFVILRRPEVDNHPRYGRRQAEFGSSHGNDGSAIHDQALRMSQFTSWKIKYKAVWMLECAYVRLYQRSKRHLHINTFSVFSNRDGSDYGMRIARFGTSGFLGNPEGRGQAE